MRLRRSAAVDGDAFGKTSRESSDHPSEKRSLSASRRPAGFTLVEVLVALVVVALGLTALMVAVTGTARTSGYLRDKTLAQWIALNRIAEVRLTVNKSRSATEQPIPASSISASRTWHYDTRYFDTSIAEHEARSWSACGRAMRRPRATHWPRPSASSASSLATPGSTVVDWTAGIVTATVPGVPNRGQTGTPHRALARRPAPGSDNSPNTP